MTGENIRLETDARGVARLTLARPQRFNALTADMMREMHGALDRLHAARDVRVVVLTGEGDMFCAGGDINMFREMGTASAEARLQSAMRGILLAHRVAALPMPTIARVNGPAYGGGIGLVAACDVTIATDAARFAFTEAKRGVAPAAGAPVMVARLGAAAYKRLLFTGRSFDAAEARRLGLLDEVVPAAGLDAEVARTVDEILAGAPGALAEMKRAIDRIVRHGPDSVSIDGLLSFAESWANEEGREGAASFLEKRRPSWDPSASR